MLTSFSTMKVHASYYKTKNISINELISKLVPII